MLFNTSAMEYYKYECKCIHYILNFNLYCLQVLSHYPISNPLRKTQGGGRNQLDNLSNKKKPFIYIKHFEFYLEILVNVELT